MKNLFSAVLVSMLAAQPAVSASLNDHAWIHGSEDCSTNRDPAIEVFQFDAATYVLRENKCVHFEAPFVYVLFGAETVFVQDTGATADPLKFPLYDTVRKLVEQQARPAGAPLLKWLVTHSHSHGDHTAGDPQFSGKPGVTLIEPDTAAVQAWLKLSNWPQGSTTIDLGGRPLVVIPAPGHQSESIAIYDAKTGWLLTGDSVYPGLLYVRDWEIYRSSIHRLAQFATSHQVSAVMGTHIEMSRTPGKVYERGTTWQPHEAALPLTVGDLSALDARLQKAGTEPEEIIMPKFIVSPIGRFQKILGTVLRWIGVG